MTFSVYATLDPKAEDVIKRNKEKFPVDFSATPSESKWWIEMDDRCDRIKALLKSARKA